MYDEETRITDLDPTETTITFRATRWTWDRLSVFARKIAGHSYNQSDSTFRVPIGWHLSELLEILPSGRGVLRAGTVEVVRVPGFMEEYRLGVDPSGNLHVHYHNDGTQFQGYLRSDGTGNTFSTNDPSHVAGLPGIVQAFTGVPGRLWLWKYGTYTVGTRYPGIPWMSDIGDLLLETSISIDQFYGLMEDLSINPGSSGFLLEPNDGPWGLRVRFGLENFRIGTRAALRRDLDLCGTVTGPTSLHRKSSGETVWQTLSLTSMIDDLFSVWNLGYYEDRTGNIAGDPLGN